MYVCKRIESRCIQYEYTRNRNLFFDRGSNVDALLLEHDAAFALHAQTHIDN